MSERKVFAVPILPGALALRLIDEMDNPPTTPEHWNGPVVSDVWQAGYRYGLSRAREVVTEQAIKAREEQ
jgi:hypothetical protein